jgi:redox-regulated HSP33 family molecular chaperone
MSNDQELLEAAKLHAEAVRIIAAAIQDMGHPTLTRKDYENNAVAILARLAHANILIERYDAKAEVSE